MTILAQKRHITKVRIENFQSHEDTEFDLSPGINLIVGSSEAGKSAILRALNFALHNLPRGGDFVRMGQTEARVHLWWSDGCYFCRIKGEHRNAVLIKDKDGVEHGFDRIGNILPPEALEVLGNPPIDDDIGPISYADQHEPLFLVTLSPSELPRAISRLTGIDDFEKAAEILNSNTNVAKRKITTTLQRIENCDKSLSKFVNLDNDLKSLEQMELAATEINNLLIKISTAKNLKKNYEDLMTMGRQVNAALKQAEKIASFGEELLVVKEFFAKFNLAKNTVNNYLNLLSLEQEANDALRISNAVANQDFIDIIKSIKEKLSNISSAKKILNQYHTLMETGKALNKDILEDEKKLLEYEKDKQVLIDEMKKTGAWCNVCQRPKSIDACNNE